MKGILFILSLAGLGYGIYSLIAVSSDWMFSVGLLVVSCAVMLACMASE